MTGKMDIRDPNTFDMMNARAGGLGNQIQAIYNRYQPNIKIVELETNMEAPDADAEIYTDFTDAFTGAAANIETITAEADVAGSLNNTYFWFYITTAQHYVWMNVNAGGTDPSVAGTAHEVAFATNATAAQVGAAIVAVIDALAISAAGTTTMVISSDAVGVNGGPASDGAGAGATGFTFVNTIAGSAAYTANYFYAVSNDVKDTAAGVGTQTIRVFIAGENGPATTDIIMAGTTPVKSSAKATEIYGMIGLTAGSEHDTAGTLVIQDYGASVVYATIAAAGMGTVTQRCWIPDGWNGKIGDIVATVQNISHATDDIVLDLAGILSLLEGGLPSGVDPDLLNVLTISHLENQATLLNDNLITPGGNGTYRTINHVTKADDANTTLYIKTRYILWSD